MNGVYTAIVTPFTQQGELDLNAFSVLIQKQIDAKIDGIVVCGSTGEGITLNDDEKFTLVKHAVQQAAGKFPVIAGAGSASTKVACELQRKMADLGVAATLQVTPWYNKPTPEGLYEHFKQIAQSANIPVILYNVPGRTGCDLSLDVVLKLATDFPNIAALKDSNLDAGRIQTLIGRMRNIRSDFSVLSGEDSCVLPLLAMGGHGVISVCSNAFPTPMLDMIRHFKAGDFEQAQALALRIAELTPLTFFRSNPIPIKSMLYLMGLIENQFRLPLLPLSMTDLDYLKQNLIKQGWM